MAKKFVRGVTGIEDIESYDKTLTNVNDILSDGKNTYLHTKKGKVDSYYNLTDNVKTIQSSGDTITVDKSDDGTVNLKTNPKKVLEHDNLLTDYGISKTSTGGKTTLAIKPTPVNEGFNLNSYYSGYIQGTGLLNAPSNDNYFVSALGTESGSCVQLAVKRINNQSQPNSIYIRTRIYGEDWGLWREQVGDKSVINALLSQKQNTITTNNSICIYGDSTLRQLYTPGNEYNVTGGYLKIILNYTNPSTNIYLNKTNFKFIVKINKNVNTVTFNLDSNDKTRFTSIFSNYGSDNTVIISGLVFSLTGSSLTVSSPTTSDKNQVITFSDIF